MRSIERGRLPSRLTILAPPPTEGGDNHRALPYFTALGESKIAIARPPHAQFCRVANQGLEPRTKGL